jgi:putative transposase
MSLDDGGRRFQFLIGNRGSKFVEAFDEVFFVEGTRVIKAPVRSPRANAHARAVRADRPPGVPGLDPRLRPPSPAPGAGRVVAHYNEARPHRAIDLDAPISLLPVGDTVAAVEHRSPRRV